MADYEIPTHNPIDSWPLDLTFEKLKDESNRAWYLGVIPNRADHCYVVSGPGTKGHGREFRFPLSEGGFDTQVGAAKMLAPDVERSLGLDVSNQYLTQGVIGTSRGLAQSGQTILFDVLHQDESPTLGTLSRIMDLAQDLADQRARSLFYHVFTSTGSVSSPIDPRRV